MDVRQCRECGKLFVYRGNPNCPECVIARDEAFVKVRDYLYKHPDTDVKTLSEKTKVSEKMILEFLKENRLSVKEGDYLLCERCGKAIRQGRYCEECREKLEQALSAQLAKTEPQKEVIDYKVPKVPASKGGRMHLKVDKDRSKI